MVDRTCLAVVLAAGEGTRMRATLPKVLHEIAGRSLLAHVLGVLREAGGSSAAVVIGPAAAVAAEAERAWPGAETFVQSERRRTAHPVLTSKQAIARGFDDLLVVFADTPLIRPQTPARMRQAIAAGAAVAVLGIGPRDPRGYRRSVRGAHVPRGVREDRE